MLSQEEAETGISAILTQVSTEGFASDLLVNLIPNLGVLSILVWFLHHTVKYTIPDLNAENNRTIEKMASDERVSRAEAEIRHRETVKELTEKFDANMREERILRQQELKDLASAIRELKSK